VTQADSPDHERHNREFWDADADAYQEVHGAQLSGGRVWGVWSIPEAELQALGDTRGLDVLELGCGGAQWSIALRRDGARCIGLDQSRGQLGYARRARTESGVDLPLLCASGESLPFADGSFDLVFCDHGAMSFCDPVRSVPEVGRVLRPGGRLVFSKATILHYITWNDAKDRPSRKLHSPYFGSGRYFDDGTVDFQIPYGEWVRLFTEHGMTVEDLVELRAPEGATTTYEGWDPDWSRQWPAEEIWRVRKI
jgi:SAM-dependent methyltransferase